MHVLTKIFVVLVSLLAVMLVPLVVVYAYNENSWRDRYENIQPQLAAAKADLSEAEARMGAETNRLQTEINELTRDKRDLRGEITRLDAQAASLQSDLAAANALKAEINSRLTTLASALDTGQNLNQTLVAEVTQLRNDVLQAERQLVAADEAVRDLSTQLDVAIAARRALQEEVQRLKEERNAALQDNRRYIARYGELEPSAAMETEGIAPDRDLTARVLSVRRNPEQGTTVEIDAGSVDGVEVGWVMILTRDGSYLGDLRITEVDMNRSVGTVSLHDEARRGRIQQNDRAIAIKDGIAAR